MRNPGLPLMVSTPKYYMDYFSFTDPGGMEG